MSSSGRTGRKLRERNCLEQARRGSFYVLDRFIRHRQQAYMFLGHRAEQPERENRPLQGRDPVLEPVPAEMNGARKCSSSFSLAGLAASLRALLWLV